MAWSAPARLEPGCDAIEHAVQAELEALVPGFRVIRVDACFYQARDPRVPARGFEPLPVALALGLELIGGQVRLGQLLVTLAAALLRRWRVHTDAADVIAAFALALLFGYVFTWAGICLA